MNRCAIAAIVVFAGCNANAPGSDGGFGSAASGGPPGATDSATGGGDPSAGDQDDQDGGAGPGGSDPTGGSASAASVGPGTGGSDAGSDTEGIGTGGSTTAGATAGQTTGGGATDNCGFPEDGPWVEVAYNQAGQSPQSPSWTFSNTPGFGAAQWAMTGDSWPEMWDRWNNINVVSDPIGVVAAVGPSSELQLMIGLTSLTSYGSATVCVEGRSVSATASVLFDAFNPLNGCGGSSSMAHDWSVHAVGIDLGQCLVPGAGVQAVRLDPTGGSSALGVRRMRVTLHNAVY